MPLRTRAVIGATEVVHEGGHPTQPEGHTGILARVSDHDTRRARPPTAAAKRAAASRRLARTRQLMRCRSMQCHVFFDDEDDAFLVVTGE
jgi:hypothetical protein